MMCSPLEKHTFYLSSKPHKISHFFNQPTTSEIWERLFYNVLHHTNANYFPNPILRRKVHHERTRKFWYQTGRAPLNFGQENKKVEMEIYRKFQPLRPSMIPFTYLLGLPHSYSGSTRKLFVTQTNKIPHRTP